MKPSKPPSDRVIPIKCWACFDGCPVCRLLRKAAEEGKEITKAEIELAFIRAEGELGS